MATDLVPAPDPRGRLIARPDMGPADCPTNLDLATELGKAYFVNALAAPDIEFGKDGTASVAMVYYLAHPAESVDKNTGEISQYSRLVLIQEDGTSFATSSPVVAHRLAQALQLYGAGPILPPLHVQVRQRLSKSARIYHDLKFLPRS